ncbi:hypothetical protein K8T06_07890 [bacterium]|nr:hypothetical protein [bacterium]
MPKIKLKQIHLLVFLLTVILMAGIIGNVIAKTLKQTRQTIVLQTPLKKRAGAPTQVIFPHRRHVNEYSAICDNCHPAIISTANAPGNSQKNVHEVCRQCHAKNKPGKTFVCANCHKKQ